MIKAVINVTAPRQQVFAVLSDYPSYTDWVPGCEQCRVTSRSGQSADTQIVINGMRRIELAVRFEAHPNQALSFRMVQGRDLKAYSGTYRLMDSADGKGTVVIAELEIEVGMMVPRFMVDRIARRMIDETGAALRKYVATARMPTGVSAQETRRAAPPETKRRRVRKILRVTKTDGGYSVWLMGETFLVKNSGA